MILILMTLTYRLVNNLMNSAKRSGNRLSDIDCLENTNDYNSFMGKTYLFILCFYIITNLMTNGFASSKHRLKYRPYFSSTIMDNDQASARVFATGVDLNYQFRVSKSLTSLIRGGALLETGSNNSLNLKEFAPEKELVLYEAKLRFQPDFIPFLELDLGSLSLNRYSSPLLLGQSVFMGLNEKLILGLDYNLQLEAIQAIPNNQTLASRSGGIEEGTPSFLMERVSVNLGGDLIAFTISASHFKFNNLSGGVANQSRYMGNDISGSAQTSYFIYDFEGYNSTLNLRLNQSSFFKINIVAEYLFNDKAPDGQNSGMLGKATLLLGDLGLGMSYFRNEKKRNDSNKK